MIPILRTRLRQGQRTIAFPAAPPALPELFRGMPVVDTARCPDGCRACADACPTQAIAVGSGAEPRVAIDLGRCLFCTECTEACPEGAIRYGQEYALATRRREDLVATGAPLRLAAALDERSRRLFGRSLKLRQVSAGGCNGCESDVNVLNTIVFDLARFGIQFVASPRHADGLLITGPVTRNMRLALHKTWQAVPEPRLVVAVGACAISGGPYLGSAQAHDGAGSLLPVDLFVPGCPPHPITILDGLLRLLGRIPSGTRTP
ncbi:MAG: 4Fe-4S dicluster domain-containing protein [Planctomycetes bacterium]|nr:4Fe-4S dicluster domain-containing protein [Planctomycetota bacterium]